MCFIWCLYFVCPLNTVKKGSHCERLTHQPTAPCVASQCHWDENVFSSYNHTAFSLYTMLSPSGKLLEMFCYFMEQMYTVSEAFLMEDVIRDKNVVISKIAR